MAALLAGLLYNLLDGKPPTVAAVHATFAHKCTASQRRALGLPPWPMPSVYASYRTLGRLTTALGDGRLHELQHPDARLGTVLGAADAEGHLAAPLDCIVQSTVPLPGDGERLWSADTTYLDANRRPISRARYDRGDRSSDPDASGRRIKRPDGTEKQFFGYAVTTVGRSEGTKEFIDGLRVDTASAHDRPKVLDMLSCLKDHGYRIERLAIDRGIKSQELNAELRSLGIEPVFDLDANEGGYEGTSRSLLIVDGWPYSPALGKRLRQPLPKPLATGPHGSEKVAQWQKHMDERQRDAWRVRQELRPGRVQLMPPAGVGCRHPALRATMRARDFALATCPGDHGPDEACGMRTVVWDAFRAPITWQNPPWGSRKWQRAYAKRSSVERGYSLLKSSDVVQLKEKAIKLRGLSKFAIMVAMACAAVNSHLASVPARNLATKRGSSPTARAA